MADGPTPKKPRLARRGLVERLAAGETILCAEGYLLAFCRMGYVAKGVWIPQFILDQPEVLRGVHYQFTHAGTDVSEAFQYFTNRRKMSQLGHEEDLEKINRIALRIARDVAEETGTLFAGGVSNIDLLADPSIKDPAGDMRAMFEEQIRWAKEEGVDYIIAETMHYYEEAKIALEVIKSFDLPAVVTFGVDPGPKDGKLVNDKGQVILADGVPIAEACRRLVEQGAEIVGVNCLWGPGTMLDMVEEIIKVVPPQKVAALPIAFRTTKEEPTWMQLTDNGCPDNNPVWPSGVDAFYVSELEITKFTKRCLELGLKYIGICCGNTGNYTRAMAEAMGRRPPASKYHDPEVITKGKESRRMREIGMERTKAQAQEKEN